MGEIREERRLPAGLKTRGNLDRRCKGVGVPGGGSVCACMKL